MLTTIIKQTSMIAYIMNLGTVAKESKPLTLRSSLTVSLPGVGFAMSYMYSET